MAFWNVTAFSILDRYQCFGRLGCLYFCCTQTQVFHIIQPAFLYYLFGVTSTNFLSLPVVTGSANMQN
jgi:hypothetical protein